MPIYRENDRIEALPDTNSREPEQLEGNQAAERRIAEYQCEHDGNKIAEADAVHRSAEEMKSWEQVSPTERRYILERVGKEMMKVHEAIAVGTVIADRPPHRPVRAALPHTVLTADVDMQTSR